MNQATVQTQNHLQSENGEKPFSPISGRHFQMMILIMLATLIYVTYVTQFTSQENLQTTDIVLKRNLIIKDDANGDILIEVASLNSQKTDQDTLKVMRFSGEQGFLRGTLRALARERRVRNLSPTAPFELALDRDGRLTLTDSITNKGIDLEAFGPDNLAVFEQLLLKASENELHAMPTNTTDDPSKEKR
jgi:putative photosynthetic complex assembly protein